MNSRKKQTQHRRDLRFQCKCRYCRIKIEQKVHLDGKLDVVLCREPSTKEYGNRRRKGKQNENVVKAVFYATTVSVLASALLSNNNLPISVFGDNMIVNANLIIGSLGEPMTKDSSVWMIPLSYFLFFTGYFYDEWRNMGNDSKITVEVVKDSWTYKLCSKLFSMLNVGSNVGYDRCAYKQFLSCCICLLTKITNNIHIQGMVKKGSNILKFGELFDVLTWTSFVIQASLTTQPYCGSRWWGVIGTVFATLSLVGNDAIWTIDLKKGWMIENVIWILALLFTFVLCDWIVFVVSIFIFAIKVFFWVDRQLHICQME